MEEAISKINKNFTWKSDNEQHNKLLYENMLIMYPYIKEIFEIIHNGPIEFTKLYHVTHKEDLVLLFLSKQVQLQIMFGKYFSSDTELLHKYDVSILTSDTTLYNTSAMISIKLLNENTNDDMKMNKKQINEFDDNKEQLSRQSVLIGGDPNDILRRRLKYALLNFIKDNPTLDEPDPNAFDRITSSDLSVYEDDGGADIGNNIDNDIDDNDDSNEYNNIMSLMNMYRHIKSKDKNGNKRKKH